MFIDWVEGTGSDGRRGPTQEKIVRNKPAKPLTAAGRAPTQFIAERQTFEQQADTTCNALFPSFAFPRYVAGGPLAADNLKCGLKKVERRAYSISFTDAEFARLKRIFPNGVCDWHKAGVEQTEVVPWASFGPAPENLVFDITDRRRHHDDDDDDDD